jgi:Dyp-type peroxidase family
MATLQSLLSHPITLTSPNSDTKKLLGNLQGNILGNHGRNHTAHMFLEFVATDKKKLRKAFAVLAKKVTTAADQEKHKSLSEAKPTPTHFNLFLTHEGYVALGVPTSQIPDDAAFKEGMAARGQKPLPHPFGGQFSAATLNDPKTDKWDSHLGSGTVHAMLLIADDTSRANRKKEEAATGPKKASLRRTNNAAGATRVATQVATISTRLDPSIIKIKGIDIGQAFKQSIGGGDEGLEHFGYVDGRSQPLFTDKSIAGETTNGIDKWDPRFNPENFIVADPGSTDPFAAGSYFVFRKLEQNVRAFKAREQELADALGLVGAARERAGALAVGRFENGTPVQLSGSEIDQPPPNNFTYGSQSDKCPFMAHIRKTNPRGDTNRLFNAPLESERSHIMARRGMTYGARLQEDDGGFADSPAGGVGLMFMAFMKDIRNQFEFTQANWANDPNFVQGGGKSAVDPVMGTPKGATSNSHWHENWSNPAKSADFDFGSFVTLLGGHYYFCPSKSFLKSIEK